MAVEWEVCVRCVWSRNRLKEHETVRTGRTPHPPVHTPGRKDGVSGRVDGVDVDGA